MSKTKNNNLLRRTYRISTLEGVFAQVFGTFSMIGSSFIVKLLVILNATPIHFSLLSSIGQVSQLFQPLGVAVTHNLQKRKKACVYITFFGRLLTLFLGISLIFTNPHTGIWFLLILLFCSAALLSIGGNIWIAWLSDIVPLSYRGRFFSRRNQVLLIAGLVAGYIGSFTIDLFDINRNKIVLNSIIRLGLADIFRPEYQSKVLSILFVISTFIGIAGLYILSKQPEKIVSKKHDSLKRLYLSPLKDTNFRKLLAFGMWWMLAIGVGSAFWSPFMLKKLQMSLFEVQIYGSIHMLSSFLSYRFWGMFIDKNGNKNAMMICVMIGGLNPMFWLFMNATSHYLIWMEALMSGFMWAGTGLVSTNFVLSIAPKGQEQVYSGLYGAMGGLCMMLTTMLSGVLYPAKLDYGIINLEPEQIIFGIGGLMRWTAIIPLIFIQETKSGSIRHVLLSFKENIILWLKQNKQ